MTETIGTEEPRPILISFNAGGEHSFVGRMPKGTEIDEVEADIADGKPIPIIEDCYPVGKQQQPVPMNDIARENPDHPEAMFDFVMAPAFGTFQWCYMEPIVKMRNVFPKWHFWIDDQSVRSQENFHHAYREFTKHLIVGLEAERQIEANLQVATPGDLKRLEESAKKLGLGVGPDLVKAMQTGRKPS